MYPSTYVRESQPDWLTVGAHRRVNVDQMSILANALATAEENDGNKRSPWRLLGYEGYRCARVRWGTARGWGLMQLSGDVAHVWLAQALACADSVSRLDLAVTIQTDRPDPTCGRVLYEQAREWRVDHAKAARPWFIGGDDTGWTTYIGQRQSDAFFRCYDKDAESRAAGDEQDVRQYENAWRFELELKGEAAEQTARRVVDSADVHRAVSALVYRWLSDRGVEPPWTPEDNLAPIGSLRRRSDRETKLAWLTQQVQPTVSWLVEHGDAVAVARALGLQFGTAAADFGISARAKDEANDRA